MYAAVSDMSARFRAEELMQLTDEAGVGEMDEAKINTALQSADNLINSYISAVYDVSQIVTAPAVLVDYACDIARYKLCRDAVGEAIQDRYDAALDWLKLVSKGTVKLDIGSGVEAQPAPATIELADSVVADRRNQMRGF